MTSFKARWAAVIVACAMGAALAAPAMATPATLKRSVENMTLWPLDVLASPLVAGQSVYQNLRDVDDTTGVRIAYTVPGYLWTVMVQFGASVIRGVTGVIEVLPGLALLFTDAEMAPLFDPAAENEALVNYETPIYDVKFGINYTSAAY